MKILVTGANGYLGQGIVRNLCDMGADIIAADLRTGYVDYRAKSMKCNIFDIENPFEYFEEPDVLLHLAWRDGFIHDSENHINDLPLHYKFIKNMVGMGIKKICVMGTMHEVGFYEGCIDEDTPCHPMSLYGISKDALRNLVIVTCMKRNIRYQWLRAYYIVGNSKYGNSIFSKISLAASEGKKEFPFTNGQNQYDFLDYQEFCYQIAAAVLQDDVWGVIEICSGKPEKLCDRVERFIKENKYDIKLLYGVYPDRPYDSKAIWGNNKKISEILDFFRKSDSIFSLKLAKSDPSNT